MIVDSLIPFALITPQGIKLIIGHLLCKVYSFLLKIELPRLSFLVWQYNITP